MACDRANPTPHNPPVGCLHPRTLNHDTTAHSTFPSLSLSSLGVRNNPSSTQAHDDDDGRVAGLRPAVDVLNDSHDLSEVPGHVPARRHTEVLHWLSTKPKSGALDDKHPHHLWQRHHRRRNRRRASKDSALQSLMEHGSSLFGVKPDQLLDPDDLEKLLHEHIDEARLTPECEHSPLSPSPLSPCSRADPRQSNVMLTCSAKT